MSSNIQKFQLSQGGKSYILTTEIENDFVKLTCVESHVPNSIKYLGLFSLNHLRRLSKIFDTMTTIYEAQEFLNSTIENQKVSIQYEQTLMNIILYFTRETESKQIIQNDYNAKTLNYNTQVIYNAVEEKSQYMQVPITTTETTENIETNINYTLPETTEYATENTYTENQTYQTYDYDNSNTYQTYENVNTNYDVNLNDAVEVQQTQTQTQIQTQENIITTPKVETLTIPLTYTPPPAAQVDNSQYLAEIEQLKNQIKILREENTILRQKTVIQTNDQSGEIMLLKQ